MEKPVQLLMEWEYESSTLINDYRSINKKQIDDYASLRFVLETYNHDGWILFGLGDRNKMDGNDFVLIKHSCGNDSNYGDIHQIEFDKETKERMKTPCDNYTYYHVEVEYIGSRS